MGYKLICGKNPRSIGIEGDAGNWDIEKFVAHVNTCWRCEVFSRAVTRVLAKRLGVFSNFYEIAQRARELAEERRPSESPQKRDAFANSVAYLVTGMAGGYGGPSVREHTACRQYGQKGQLNGHWPFEEAANLLLREDGPIFGPLTSFHRQCWREEHCFDDDPQDIVELEQKS